jgi:hypothetical protein
MQTHARILCLVAILVVSSATAQPWIVQTTYLNDGCMEQAPLGLSTLTSFLNDTCIPTGPSASRRLYVYETSLYTIIYSNRNCSGVGSSGPTSLFSNGTCENRTTEFTGLRSARSFLSDSMIRAPSGVYNGMEVETYADSNECASRGTLATYTWKNFADYRTDRRGISNLGSCWPEFFTPTYNLWMMDTCNATHIVTAMCNDPQCTDCSILAAESTKCLNYGFLLFLTSFLEQISSIARRCPFSRNWVGRPYLFGKHV